MGTQRSLWLRASDTVELRPIAGTEDAHNPFWSPDSRFLGFFAGGKLKKVAKLSPDGRWMAYTSDESGRAEVYVQAFPKGSGPEGKWRISTSGGSAPRWRGDGKELFYADADARLTAVPVKAAGPKTGFEVGAPEPLFGVSAEETTLASRGWDYDVTADGKRFLARTSGAEAAPSPLVVVTNWQASLKK